MKYPNMVLHKLVCLTLFSGLAFPVNAQAQQSSDEAAGEIELIEVIGYRASLRNSIGIKRDSDAIVDAVSAEDIGKFPDKNIAESLQRVTGVSIDRTFGEGEKVAIRGAGPELNRTLLNGQNIGTEDWQIFGGGSRSFNFAMLASEVVGGLEVFKTPQANIDEGAIGGTVILRTRDPLDLESGTSQANIQLGYSGLADAEDPQLSGLYSYKNPEETFGFLISGVYQDRTIRRDGIEVLGYDEIPRLIGSALFRQERERRGFNSVAQFRPNDNLDIRLHYLRSEVGADNSNHNYLALPLFRSDPLTNVTRDDGIITSGRYEASSLFVQLDAIGRVAAMETEVFDFDLEYSDEDYEIHVQAGYTEGAGGSNDTSASYRGNTSGGFDIRGSAPVVTFDEVDPTNPADLYYNRVDILRRNTSDEEFYAQVDYTRYVEFGAINSLQFGLKYRDQERGQVDRFGLFFLLDGRSDPAFEFVNTTIGNTPGDFLNGIAGPGTLDVYPLVDIGFFQGEIARTNPTVPLDPRDSWDIGEQILAAYGMATFEADRWRGNIGVRVVETDSSAEAYVFTGSPWILPLNPNAPVFQQRISAGGGSRTDVLPSLNAAYDLNDDVVLRFAAARAMARPEFFRLSPNLSLNDDTRAGTSGNPNLEPQFSNQLDLGWEWYFDEGALVSAGVFYKDIEGYLGFETTREQHVTGACPTPCEFTVTRSVNAGSGTNRGIEASYQQDFDNGFGFVVNYTYSDAKAPDDAPIPYNSRHSYNLIGYYESETVTARFGYNWRDKYFEEVNRGSELQIDSIGQLDVSFAYNLTENIQLTLEGTNLTDELLYKFGKAERFPRAYYLNGRRVFAGVRMNF